MGYTTEFYGSVAVEPPLSEEEIKYLNKFSETRRMARKEGPYFVDGEGFMGQGKTESVLDYNSPPQEQPSLWCQWVPSEDGTEIQWDGGEKFYCADEWMMYIINHFIGSNPSAAESPGMEFIKPHICNGFIEAQGEEYDDKWAIKVTDNVVTTHRATVTYDI
jgi:hypothetical protein